jgi:hypothetical protein
MYNFVENTNFYEMKYLNDVILIDKTFTNNPAFHIVDKNNTLYKETAKCDCKN